LEHASRAFSVRADRGRSLKELLIGRARAGGPPPVQALKDVSLRIEPGETVGMVGRNGAGKSSTLRVLSGIVPLNSGRVACGGEIVDGPVGEGLPSYHRLTGTDDDDEMPAPPVPSEPPGERV